MQKSIVSSEILFVGNRLLAEGAVARRLRLPLRFLLVRIAVVKKSRPGAHLRHPVLDADGAQGQPGVHVTVEPDGPDRAAVPDRGDADAAPGEAVALEPGGMHIMLMDLQRPMVEGESYTLSVIFADGTEASVEVPILGIAARGPSD